jgi:sec-independent protein translocase protein TatA
MGLSTSEIIVIAVVVLLLFGAKKIPEIARALGKASHEYQKAKENIADEIEKASGEKKDPEKDKADEKKQV